MSKRDNNLLLEDVIEASQKILIYTNGLQYKDFIDDSKTVDAVIRNFIIIGEAANNMGIEFKEKHKQVDWFRITGFRNRVAHDYIGIDYEIVWNIITNYLHKLIEDINGL